MMLQSAVNQLLGMGAAYSKLQSKAASSADTSELKNQQELEFMKQKNDIINAQNKKEHQDRMKYSKAEIKSKTQQSMKMKALKDMQDKGQLSVEQISDFNSLLKSIKGGN